MAVLDEGANIGNSEPINNEEKIGACDRIDKEDEIRRVSEWMTERGLGTSRNQ
jgi:hypothetical protein